MGAVNSVSEVLSDTVAFLLASVPSGLSAPTSISDGTYLQIIMTTPSTDGGSFVTSYQLLVQYSYIEGFVTVLGQDGSHNLDLTYIV